MAMPTRPNERWPVGFMSDQLASGRRFRILNVVDDFSRPCVGQLVATSITGARLALFLDELGKTAAPPKAVVCDNGPELTSKAMRFWSERSGAAPDFIQPGKPTQNAFVESFNGKFRDSCLTRHWFRGLADVRRIVNDWRHHCDHERPRGSLGCPTPAERAKQAVPSYTLSNWTCLGGRSSEAPATARRRQAGHDPRTGGAPPRAMREGARRAAAAQRLAAVDGPRRAPRRMFRPGRPGPDANDGGKAMRNKKKAQAGHAGGPRACHARPCYHGGAPAVGQRSASGPGRTRQRRKGPLSPRRCLARAFRP